MAFSPERSRLSTQPQSLFGAQPSSAAADAALFNMDYVHFRTVAPLGETRLDHLSAILGRAEAIPSSQVLSVAYDQGQASLFVLDVDDEPISPSGHAPHMARLVRYDIQNETATQIATWPRVGAFQELHLAMSDDGHLIVVGARKHNWMAWRLRVDGSQAVFEGVRQGAGQVLDRPVMGAQELVLPVVRNNRPLYIELDAAGFHGGAQCSAL